MEICIDAREVQPRMNGLGRYALNLVRHLARLDHQNHYTVLRHASYPVPLVIQDNFREIAIPYGNSALRNALLGSRSLSRFDFDIFHALFHFIPHGITAKQIVLTMHDLIWVDHRAISDSRWYRRQVNRLAELAVGRDIKKTDRIIAVSQSTRDAICKRFSVAEEKITVIHHGTDLPNLSSVSKERLPAVCRDKRFVFSLGNAKPYKNIKRLMSAFSLVLRQSPDLFLVISGPGDNHWELFKYAEKIDIADRIVLLSNLKDEEIQACFKHAILFAFPSLVEGFGFPVLEAMAHNCPVLTSAISSLPEIAGDAAILVDPYSVQAIAQGMQDLIHNGFYRSHLASKGPSQAAHFTWDACAKGVLDLYREFDGCPLSIAHSKRQPNIESVLPS